MVMGDQMILEEDFDENYEPTEEGLLLVVHYYFMIFNFIYEFICNLFFLDIFYHLIFWLL